MQLLWVRKGRLSGIQIENDKEKADKRVKADIALHGNPVSELRDVTCHMASHSVTCHPTTQVHAPRLTESHAGWYSIYLTRRDGRLS